MQPLRDVIMKSSKTQLLFEFLVSFLLEFFDIIFILESYRYDPLAEGDRHYCDQNKIGFEPYHKRS